MNMDLELQHYLVSVFAIVFVWLFFGGSAVEPPKESLCRKEEPVKIMRAKHKTGWRSLPHEMHRCCLDFTTPGFAPLKRVNKMFKAFEESVERVSAVAAVLKERKKILFISHGHQIAQRLPYVTSATLVEWTHREMQMPMDKLVSIAAAYGGHIEVLQWARAQEPPCSWDKYVCISAAENGI